MQVKARVAERALAWLFAIRTAREIPTRYFAEVALVCPDYARLRLALHQHQRRHDEIRALSTLRARKRGT